MATDATQPASNSPVALTRNHSRRNSTRRSFTSGSVPVTPKIQSPRTLCPRDGDAFSYKASHLPQWFVPEELYRRLPLDLQAILFRFQHVGAAVLTGYERLEHYNQNRDNNLKLDDEVEVRFDESDLPLPSLPLKLRTESSASSHSLKSISSAVFNSSQSSESSAVSPASSASHTHAPVSPICLTPPDELIVSSKRSRNHSFSTPQEPHNAYYGAELDQLRTESMPRLRHAARNIELEWYECKRQGAVSSSDIIAFEQWWADKKNAVRSLDERCKRLTFDAAMAAAGTGWTAP